MLILLPPSEGKTAPVAGEPADPAAMFLPQLGRARARVQGRLVAMCSRSSARSVTASLGVLGLSPGQRAEIARNATLREAPAAPAAEVYSGVLYEALDARGLPPEARAWLDERAVVFSGLWGALRLPDRIPAYRCAAGVVLPGIGGLTPYWKKLLSRPLEQAAAGGPVLDLRSGAYASMWTPAGAVAERTLALRVLHGGAVVSHFNKATKGRLVRSLAVSGATPETVDELIEVLREKHNVEERPTVAGRPRQLDLMVSEL